MRKCLKNTDSYTQRGVTLAEFSVVIVIIAMLLAVVAGGVSINKAAELRSVITDVESYRIAIEGFYSKYEDLPGDMTDAHSYWNDGADGVCGTAAECNGDGDGLIDMDVGVNQCESYRAWQHLELGGFVEGGYTGVSTGNYIAAIGVNIPASKIEKAGYTLKTHTYKSPTAENGILLGSFLSTDWAWGAVISPVDAYSIDKKMDNGVAGSGKVSASEGSGATNCRSGVAYVRTNTEVACSMAFDF